MKRSLILGVLSFGVLGLVAACGQSAPQEAFVPVCGDGVVEGAEQCDDGNSSDSDECLANCKVAFCGDGYLWQGVEQCDDGNVRDGDACDASCTAASGCGNGVLDSGEACDDGNAVNSDGCVAGCIEARCGDGYAQLGTEECDDGNEDDADGCRNDCTLSGSAQGTCPGLQLPVSTAKATSVVGDTSVAEDSGKGSCGGDGTPDMVYAVVPKTDGWLMLNLTGINGGDPLLLVRAASCTSGAELVCADDTAANGTEQAALQVTAGDTYYVFVDSGNGKPTHYSLNIALQTQMPGDSCPGVGVALPVGETVQVTGDTSGAESNYKGEGYCDGAKLTKELVYTVTPTKTGTLTVIMDPTHDGILYARVGSCSTGMQVACSDQSWSAGGPEGFAISVVAGTKYSIFADGYAGQSGEFNLQFTLEP